MTRVQTKPPVAQHMTAARETCGASTTDDAFAQMARMAVSLAVGFMLDDARERHSPDGTKADNCYADSQVRRVRKKLLELIERLPEGKRALISAHCFEGQPFDELAQEMQLSTGRVSHVKKSALSSLLDSLGDSPFDDWRV